MKNIHKAVIGLFVVCTIGLMLNKVSAQQTNLTNRIDSLNADNPPFGYSTTKKISVQSIDNQKITLSSPLIVDELGGSIKNYTIMYSEYSLDQMTTNTTLLNQSKEKTSKFLGTETGITMDLGLYDGIDPNKVYYILVMPKNDMGIGGEISNEIRFKLADKTYGDGIYTGTTATSMAVHAAAGANMSLAHITHACTPDCSAIGGTSRKISLKRISVIGSSLVDISLQTDAAQGFTKLATVNMSDESYDLMTTKNGEHIFKFTPDNGGTEYHYTVNIAGLNGAGGTKGTTKGITKVPKTGPAENMIVVVLITLSLYFAYRKMHRK